MKKMNISIIPATLAIGCILGIARITSATEPYDTLVTTSPSGAYRVELRPNWDGAISILNSSNNILHAVSMTQVLQQYNWDETIVDNLEVSTAGLNWHLNSIAYIATNDTSFIMRHRSGNYIVIDLANGQPRTITKEEASAADERVRETAVSLLYSADSRDRETGCIHCGQLGATQAISRLRELLADKEFYGVSGGNYPEPIVFLYVRKAAIDALLALGHNSNHIRFEYPESQVMRYDENVSRYVIDLPAENGIEQAGPGYPPQGVGSPDP